MLQCECGKTLFKLCVEHNPDEVIVADPKTGRSGSIPQLTLPITVRSAPKMKNQWMFSIGLIRGKIKITKEHDIKKYLGMKRSGEYYNG